MSVIYHSLLVSGAVFSCALSHRWLGTGWRRSMVLSLILGAVCALTACLHLEQRIAGVLCMILCACYLPLTMKLKNSMMDAVAVTSIACACYGMLQTVAGTIFYAGGISQVFKLTLILLCFLGTFFVCRAMGEEFPGAGWQEFLIENMQIKGQNDRFDIRLLGCLFLLYGCCCAVPAIAGMYGFAVIFPEIFGFFCGLKLIDLIIINQRERQTALTEKQYRDDMQTYMSVIRSQRHDYNFHVQTLHGLLLQKDYDACEKYLDELLKDSIRMNQLLPLADAAVSALILSFQSRAAQSRIPMEIVIENNLSRIVTNVYETNKIIGNLLQNALDETEGLEDKSYGIKLSILKRGEFCLISVSNRTQKEKPMAAYRVGHSDKAGHEGIGIVSIQALAAKYGGVVYSRMEQDIIYFIAKIPLRLVEEEQYG